MGHAMFNDPKQLELLEQIARRSKETNDILKQMQSQLTWLSILLIPILIANAAAAVKLFLLG